MNDPGPSHREKISVGGIKFSPELVLVNISGDEITRILFDTVLKHLSDNSIPIPFLSQSGTTREWLCSFCVDSIDWPATRTFLNDFPTPTGSIESISPAGLLTIFPHKNSLLLLGRISSLFGSRSAPLYGFNTSISATTYCTDYRLLDAITDRILQHIQLPENHAPFRPEFILKQPR